MVNDMGGMGGMGGMGATGASGDAALTTLRDRFARGAIDRTEYETADGHWRATKRAGRSAAGVRAWPWHQAGPRPSSSAHGLGTVPRGSAAMAGNAGGCMSSMGDPAAPALFFARRGTTGPAVVFLHGLAGSGRYWQRVEAALPGDGLRAYYVDLLGFGRSPWPAIAYTVDEHLAALAHWRAATGLAAEPLVLVGHSVGALLALEWAARLRAAADGGDHAGGVAGLVLVSLPVYHDPAVARQRLARLSLLHRLTLQSRPLAHAACAVMCRFRPLWRAVVPLVIRHVPPDVARDGVMHTWSSLSGTLDHCLFGLTFDHLHRRAAGLALTFVHGADDDTAPIAAVRELVTTLPQARLVEVPASAHDVPLSHPRAVVEAYSPAATVTLSLD